MILPRKVCIYLLVTSTRPPSLSQQHHVNVFRSDNVLILLSNPLEFANTNDELIAAAPENRLSLLLLWLSASPSPSPSSSPHLSLYNASAISAVCQTRFLSLAVLLLDPEPPILKTCAIADLCTHDNGPLGEGILANGQVECPRHGARFDACSGAVKALPAVRPVKTYAVKVEDNDILVDVG